MHILDYDRRELFLPLDCRVTKATVFPSGVRVGLTKTSTGYVLTLPEVPSATASADYVVELITR